VLPDGDTTVAIPLVTLVPGVSGGSEVYVRELLRKLEANAAFDYRVLVPPAAPDAGGGLPSVVAGHGGPRLLALCRSALGPPIRDADLVHYPLTVPVPRTKAPTIVTLHDLQHRDLPQLFSRTERAYRSIAYDRAAQRADAAIVISEFVRDRALDLLGLDPAKVHVTPLGLDHSTLRPGAGEREPFLYYPARPWPHKNHRALFEALPLIRRERPDLRLVLTGGGGLPPLPDGAEAIGHVPRTRVIELLQRASALVFPSLYEGFGLPPLEAMACGTPVACSNAGALPEVVGDAARIFDPRDPRAIADATLELLADPAPWTERGLARAAGFSWDATARSTEGVYRGLLA
jgi:glycosyltransferase involved in cell wall biosynthesis